MFDGNRIDPVMAVSGTPIAVRTYEGWSEPDEQAEPPETQIPASLNRRSNFPPSA